MCEQQSAAGHQRGRERKSILVIEDDDAIAQIIVLTINEETPHDAQFVTTPQEALQLLEHLDLALFLIDYQLPGMNGLQLYDVLQEKEIYRDVPAIMMSANLPWNELKKRKLTGVEKPFDLEHLLQLIDSLIV